MDIERARKDFEGFIILYSINALVGLSGIVRDLRTSGTVLPGTKLFVILSLALVLICVIFHFNIKRKAR